MLGNPKKYILTFSQVAVSDLELVGEKVLRLRRAEQSGINIPQGFIITTTAFDDFLTANDLVDFIAPRINDVDLEDKDVAKKSGTEIQEKIRKSVIPDIVLKPILQAYNNLSGFTKSFIRLKTSFPSIAIEETNYGKENILEDISGEERLIESIKEMWASLFSPQALSFRAKASYEGYLTSAILAQKMVQAELSGKVFSIAQMGNDVDSIEISAIYGNSIESTEYELTPDSYIGSKKNEEITEKRVVTQEYMYVRKHNTKGDNPNLKINLSNNWKKKQKLDDRHIINLIRMAKILEELFKVPQEIDYVLESGKIYVYNFQTIKNIDMAVKSQMQRISDKIAGKAIDLKKAESNSSESGPMVPKLEKPTQKLVTDYVKEINASKESSPVSSIEASKEKDDSAVEKVVTTLEPLEKLTKIISAKVQGDKLSFGLSHFVYTPRDWVGLTGDEILVVDHINPRRISVINQVRGVISSGPIEPEILAQITVPVIFEANDVFQLLHENEIITLDPESSSVYLGAGKATLKLPEKNSIETQDVPGDSINNEEIETEQIIPKEEIETSIETESIEKMPDPVQIINKEDQIENTFKFKPFKISKTEDKNVIPKTTSDFIQFVEFDNLEIDPNYVDGIFIDLTDLYLFYKIDPLSLIKKSKQKRLFIEEFVILISDISEKLKSKYIILNGGSITKLSDVFTGGEITKVSLMQIELELISVLRNRENMRNIWYGLTDVNSARDQIEQKKTISSFGLRRTATFKIITNLQNILASLTIKNLVSDGTDGVLVDMDSIISVIYNETAERVDLDAEVNKFLGWLTYIINTNGSKPYILTKKLKLTENLLNEHMQKGHLTYIQVAGDLKHTKPLVTNMEKDKIEKKKKKGRKKKIIDYGF